MGRLVPASQQLCLAHGIQLAVLEVLYDKPKKKSTPILVEETSHSDSDVDYESHDERDDESDDENDPLCFLSNNVGAEEITLSHETLQPLITKVRQVVKMFRRSPTKNDDLLQRYVKNDFQTEISLSLDCRTRWNSLLSMLEKFFKIRYCVKKALIDLKSNIHFSDKELDLLDELYCLSNLQ